MGEKKAAVVGAFLYTYFKDYTSIKQQNRSKIYINSYIDIVVF